MKSIFFTFFLGLITNITFAQKYSNSSIFSHNDYAQTIPFLNAYKHEVGYIEADVFLVKNELYVAHTGEEIDKDITLEKLYLKPLQENILKNNGFVYTDQKKVLTLMIDIKTEGAPTLNKLVKKLEKFPHLQLCPTLKIAISGNVPDPTSWKNYPNYIYFDGRPGIEYNDEQLSRILLISSSFEVHSKWNGKGALQKADEEKIIAIVEEVHSKGKMIRFWAIPDFEGGWIQLLNLNVDIINTDHVSELADFLKDLPAK